MKSDGLRIAFGKIGKACRFRPEKFGASGGDNEPMALLQALANHNPRDTFYLIGKSDWHKLTPEEKLALFPHGNVEDVWSEFYLNKPRSQRSHWEKVDEEWKYLEIDDGHDEWAFKYFDDLGFQPDVAVFMTGQIATATLTGITRLVNDPTKTTSPLEMTRLYSTHMIRWLNDKRVPWVEIVNDSRYHVGQCRDIIHHPTVSLGQYDTHFEFKHIKSYEDQTHVRAKYPTKYAGMETMFCVGRQKPNVAEIAGDRPTDFMVVLNEGEKRQSGPKGSWANRYNVLDEWVLRHFPDVEVYGKWALQKAKDDPRFKGTLHLEQLQAKLRGVKTTFVIPISPGWVTSKYLEMAHAGVVPFLHPTYDDQRHVAIPDFLRVKSVDDFKRKMRMVCADDDLRLGILLELSKLLKDEYYDGTFLSTQIMSTAYSILGRTWSPQPQEWKPTHTVRAAEPSLESFFT